jgi:hypothetical protein
MRDEGPRTVVEDDGGIDIGVGEGQPGVAFHPYPPHPLTGKRVSIEWVDGEGVEEFVVRAVFGGLIQLEELGEDGRPDGQFSWLPVTSALVIREVRE